MNNPQATIYYAKHRIVASFQNIQKWGLDGKIKKRNPASGKQKLVAHLTSSRVKILFDK